MIWLFKLTVTPLLIAAATLVTRRFGPRVGGLLLGFPLMAGPISVFFAVEQGNGFAAAAANGTLRAITAVAGFAAIYGLLAPAAAWLLCLAVAIAGFFGISAVVSKVDIDIVGAGLGAYLCVAMALAALRPPRLLPSPAVPPWWDIWLRMATSALLVAVITLVADRLGPTWSGIIGAFPVITTVAICFMHQQWGHAAAVVGLRGILLSLYSFVSFFICLGLALPRHSVVQSYLLATAAAVLTSLTVHAVEQGWQWASGRT